MTEEVAPSERGQPAPAGDGYSGRMLLLSADLMLAVRLEAAAAGIGLRLESVARLNDLRTMPELSDVRAVVIDLAASDFPVEETAQALRSRRAYPLNTLAFFPHVMKDLGQRGRTAGYTVVVPRSQFMSDMSGLLSRLSQGRPLATERE